MSFCRLSPTSPGHDVKDKRFSFLVLAWRSDSSLSSSNSATCHCVDTWSVLTLGLRSHIFRKGQNSCRTGRPTPGHIYHSWPHIRASSEPAWESVWSEAERDSFVRFTQDIDKLFLLSGKRKAAGSKRTCNSASLSVTVSIHLFVSFPIPVSIPLSSPASVPQELITAKSESEGLADTIWKNMLRLSHTSRPPLLLLLTL